MIVAIYFKGIHYIPNHFHYLYEALLIFTMIEHMTFEIARSIEGLKNLMKH